MGLTLLAPPLFRFTEASCTSLLVSLETRVADAITGVVTTAVLPFTWSVRCETTRDLQNRIVVYMSLEELPSDTYIVLAVQVLNPELALEHPTFGVYDAAPHGLEAMWPIILAASPSLTPMLNVWRASTFVWSGAAAGADAPRVAPYGVQHLGRSGGFWKIDEVAWDGFTLTTAR
eukprot:NODE_16538_length_989_cov_4.317865.p2 GENE.NODE_16538_length_989_cov_4.317865~~NODE_16538_length_989_cov_4.317865.p2  ORF type:complete len:199 (+),score=53.76 NODE_16538_length_989_cov_4.317865:73-597(+)